MRNDGLVNYVLGKGSNERSTRCFWDNFEDGNRLNTLLVPEGNEWKSAKFVPNFVVHMGKRR